MAKVIANSQGKVVVAGGKALLTPPPSIDFPKYTGHVDTAGLTALGWDSDDIQWLQDHVWWDAKDDAYWAVTEANLAFGPNGSTPLTWADRASIKSNPDVRYFPKFDPSPSSNTSWNALFSGYQYIFAIPTHGWNTSHVTSFGSFAAGCIQLLSCGDLSGWVTAACTALGSMFQNCYLLSYIGDISNWDLSNVTALNSVFQNCGNIVNLGDLSGWNIAKVQSITGMFSGCTGLRYIGDLSGWDTSSLTRMDNAFYNCERLTKLDLTNWNTSSLTNMSSAFSGCHHINSLGDLSDWSTGNVVNMYNVFSNCFFLTGVGDLSSWDTGKVTDVRYFFSNVRNLHSIKLSDWDSHLFYSVIQFFCNVSLALEIDVFDWDLSGCTASDSVGSTVGNSPFVGCRAARIIRFGPKFFNFSPTTLYMNQCFSWSRDSVYESLYTNQTLRDSNSPAKTVALYSVVYDSLSQQDIADIATKNITLTRNT